MRFSVLLSLFVGLVLITGCGSTPPPETTVTPQQHETVWKDLITNIAKKKNSPEDKAKVLKKHNISEEEWVKAERKYQGCPASLQSAFNKASGIPE